MLDPDLAEGLAPEARVSLRQRMLAQIESLPVEDWSPPNGRKEVAALLVIDGLLVQEGQGAGRTSAELFGAGDMIHPPGGEDDPSATPAGRTGGVHNHETGLDRRGPSLNGMAGW